MKRTAIKKQSKKDIPKLKRKLWQRVSKYIRERDRYTCFTCGKKGEGSGMHAGHFIPDAAGGALLRFHPTNIHAQCYHCNINLGGYGSVYYSKMAEKYGQEMVDKIFQIKNYSIQADGYFYLTLIDLYDQGDEMEIIKFLESYI